MTFPPLERDLSDHLDDSHPVECGYYFMQDRGGVHTAFIKIRGLELEQAHQLAVLVKSDILKGLTYNLQAEAPENTVPVVVEQADDGALVYVITIHATAASAHHMADFFNAYCGYGAEPEGAPHGVTLN